MAGSANIQNDPLNAITHLRLDFTGCEYQPNLDSEIRKEFSECGIRPIIRGQSAPAAGAGLDVDIVMTIATEFAHIIAAGIIYDAIKAVIHKICNATSEALNKNCYLGRITIETDTCDYIIRARSGAGVHSDDIDYSSLIEQMMQLHDDELADGNTVIRIETPYEIKLRPDGFSVKQSDLGSFSLWKVTYVRGERWPEQLYDAANECFIAAWGDTEMETREDIFYSGTQ